MKTIRGSITILAALGLLLCLPGLLPGFATVRVVVNVIGAFYEHFEDPPGQPSGWQDESNDDAHNAELTANGDGSAKLVKTGTESWGKAVSTYFTVDLDRFPVMRTVVSQVDAATDYKVSLKLSGSDTLYPVTNPYDGTGIHTYDIPTQTGLGGVQTVAVVLVVETGGVNGVGTRFDEVAVLPGGTDAFLREDFEETAGQPGGWWDETNDTGNNAEIEGNGVESAKVIKVDADVWGKVLSDTLTVDLDVYPFLSVIVTGIDSGARYKVSLLPQGSSTLEQLSADGAGTGVFHYHISTLLGWSGTRSFSVVLVVETAGTNNIGVRFDAIQIGNQPF